MGIELKGFAGRSAVSDIEREGLLEIIPEKGSVIEIGTLDGTTVAYWATKRNKADFLSIDPFRAGTGTGPGNPENWMKNKKPNMWLFVGTSWDYITWAGRNPEKVDIVFVDGDHSEGGCYNDLLATHKHLVKEDGVIVAHDYGREKNHLLAGVTRAVDKFVKETDWKISKIVGYMAFLKK